MKIFTSLYNYLCLNKTTFKKIFLFILISYLFTDFTFAEDKTEVDPLLSFFNWLLKISSVILWALTAFSSVLLHPGWTSWSVIWLDVQLKTLWIFVSNIVYFVFAMLFIYIAVMNIIWKWGDYELKNALPRFIIWVLIVPFSWFIVQFVISLSWVLTVWVLSLPYDTFKDTVFKEALQSTFPTCEDWAITINSWNTDKEEESDWKSTSEKAKNDGSIMSCTKKVVQTKLEDVLDPAKSQNLFWILTVYTYGVMQIDKAWKIFQWDITLEWSIKTIFDAILKFWFDLIFIIAYCLLIIALVLVLIVRWFWLWLFTMFSPAFWLLYFFKKNSSWIWDAKNFNFMQFVKLAMMPVYVAWALSFWLLFLFVAWKWLWGAEKNSEFQIINSWSTIKIHNQEITFSWSLNKWTTPIPWFTWSIGTFILQFFWLAILWIAVIAWLKSSEITTSVVSPFENLGKSVWWLVKNLPSYAPIIPTPGWMMWAKNLESMAWSFSGAIINNNSSKASQMWIEAAKKFWFGDDDLNKLASIIADYKQSPSNDKLTSSINNLVWAINPNRLNETNYRQKLSASFWDLWATEELRKEIEKNWTNLSWLSEVLARYWKWEYISKWWNQTVSQAVTKTNIYNQKPTDVQSLIWSWNTWWWWWNSNNPSNNSNPFSDINNATPELSNPELMKKKFLDIINENNFDIDTQKDNLKYTLINKFSIPDAELTDDVLKDKGTLKQFLKLKQWTI